MNDANPPVASRPLPALAAIGRRKSLAEIVQDTIKSYILEYSLGPGDALPPETELAQQLGISRVSVREAVKSLEALGIVKARPGAGLFVSDFSFDPILDNFAYGIMFDLDSLKDIIEIRYLLEYHMLERAVEMVTPDQLKRLQSILNTMRVQAEEGLYSAEDDRAFHRALWENVDNIVLGKILDIFWAIHHQARSRDSISEPPDPMYTYRRHESIFEALQSRDLEALQTAMDRHYTAMQARL